MEEIIGIESAEIVAARLKEARLATGASTRKVAEELTKRFSAAISHATIANYEKAGSSTSPPVRIIALLATIYDRPLNWFLQRSRPLVNIRYRYTSSRVLVGERCQYETKAQHWLEGYVNLEKRLGSRLIPKYKIENYRGHDPFRLATELRELYQVPDSHPVLSVIRVLEDFGIRVLELPTTSRIDGLTAIFGDEIAVVLNPNTANDRWRFNAAHELFHAINGDCEKSGKTTKPMEDAAHDFASFFLIPQSELKEAFTTRSAVQLVQAKERFGISMAAMIYRAEKTKVIDARTAKWLWIQFAKRGWRASEPGSVRPDRAIRLETLIDKAISSKSLLWTDVLNLLGVTRAEVTERLNSAIGSNSDSSETQSWKGGPMDLRVHDGS